MERLTDCDVVFPVLHGTNGEDGTIQGFFQMLGIPYVGCNHVACSICMDKVLTKRLAIDCGIETAPYVAFSRYEWSNQKDGILERISSQLKYPLFVKPSHLGSSVGVHKVTVPSELSEAIDDAFRFDTDVLVENGIQGRECEFSVHGNDTPVTYPPGEILADGGVYDYEMKYGTHGMETSPKAKLTPELIERGMEIAKRAYRAVGCMGMARVDTFLDGNGKFWLNEINTIPGFTQISLYPKICEANGLSGKDLVDRLIILALHRQRRHENLELKS